MAGAGKGRTGSRIGSWTSALDQLLYDPGTPSATAIWSPICFAATLAPASENGGLGANS
jgi:hypothetical protein